MRRRNFLKTALGGAAALAAANLSSFAQDTPATSAMPRVRRNRPNAPEPLIWRGVNLGGWLVLEKWMVSQVYRGTNAPDEFTLCQTLGDQAVERLNQHRETFITAEDFRWIKQHGLNAVRLPVGYWALEAPQPYVECARFIDFALEQAQANGLKVLLDLHGAPGSQNGWDHSGREGEINWPKDPQNIAETLRILESFAQKYGRHPALGGIELLNEPRDSVPLEILKPFYRDACARLRPHLNADVAVIFHDGFRALAWKQFMLPPDFTNVMLDTHIYQCFGDDDKKRDAHEQLAAALKRRETLDEMQREGMPVIVGEWSLGLPGRAMEGLTRLQVDVVKRAYGAIQLLNYEATRGWFFWSYKLERDNEWNFRHCVNRGWLPDNFAP